MKDRDWSIDMSRIRRIYQKDTCICKDHSKSSKPYTERTL